MFQSDEEIAALLAMNMEGSFEQLMLKYEHQLQAYAFQKTGNIQDAEDIVQLVFEKAYYALQRYPEQQVRTLKLRAWLYKITSHMCYNLGRAKLPLSVSMEASEEGPLRELENDPGEQPEAVLESAERRRELEALLATLPEQYREVVYLHLFEGFKYEEIADMLKQPPGTIRVYAHRGIRLLRQALACQANEV